MDNLLNHNEVPTFFCDLDHTLIYSHRVPLRCPKRTVEMLNGKPQSFMTEYTYEFLLKQKSVQLVPVTTRSIKQYERVAFFQNSQYALVCNGGVLLINGQKDEEWYAESLSSIAEAIRELEIAQSTINMLLPGIHIHDVQKLFFYVKADAPADLALMLKAILPMEHIEIFHDSKKVYCLPQVLTKGAAVSRFIEKCGLVRTMAAGDSSFDITMLNAVDTALYPQNIGHLICAKEKIPLTGAAISDEICRYLKEISKGR